MEAKTGAMDGLRPGCFICEKFSEERSLRKIPACHRHCSTVGFEEEIRAICRSAVIREIKGKYPIRDDTQVNTATHIYFPPERLTRAFEVAEKLGFRHQPDSAIFSACEFKGHHYVRNQECVLKKQPSNGTVCFARTTTTSRASGFRPQNRGTLVSETVNNVTGTAAVVVINLCPWPFQKAMVIEQLQPSQKVLRTAPDDCHNLRRTKKTVPVNEPDDFPVTLRQLERGKIG